MDFIWQESDIIPARVLYRVDISEEWIIGKVNAPYFANRPYVFVSLLDGQVTCPYDKLEMCKLLNSQKYVPKDL